MLAYKFRSLDQLDRIADILVNQRLYCPKYFELNDPFEGMCIVRGVYQHVGNKTQHFTSTTTMDDLDTSEGIEEKRVCSLSGSFNDVRLWSHYAGGHKGVAIEIDFEGFNPEPRKVIYNKNLKIYSQNLGEWPTATDVLSNKTIEWEYEDEYRIFHTEPYVKIDGKITQVLLGVKCPSSDEVIINRLVPAGTPVVKTRLDAESTTVQLK